MPTTTTDLIQSVHAAARCLSDAKGHLIDLRAALVQNRSIDAAAAYATYRAATTPAAIRRTLAAVKRAGLAGLVTPASIRADAAAYFCDAVGAES